MSGHTPGPWDWYWRGSDGEADCGVYWEKYQGHAYSVCRAPRYQTEEQWAADARLIAAAPESHEANKLSLTVLCAIRAAGVLSHDTNILRDLDSAIGANRAAIAKAVGP